LYLKMADEEQAPESPDLAAQRRRLETLGRLAGNVVHDFNNLLMVIDGYARMMLEEENLSRNSRESAQEILNASDRAAVLTRQLLAFSRKKPLQTVQVDLNALLKSMRPVLMRLLGETVQLDYSLCSESAVISANLSQVEQVLLNLIVNARDAMPVGGRIVVRTRREAEVLVLEVEDSGTGIPEGLQGRIFEPYFTTKPEGKGTGIGLAMVAETIDEWGGSIEASSLEGQGALFTLRLKSLAVEAEAELVEGSAGTILVVEDEAGIRSLIRRVLEQRHFEVLEAASEVEAREAAGTVQTGLTDHRFGAQRLAGEGCCENC
jgi:two-component system cell cycle sensor histidine kinase/response regulator CckA